MSRQCTPSSKYSIVRKITGAKNRRSACLRWEISYQTYRNWLKRLQDGNNDIRALEPKSRRPHRSPSELTDDTIVSRICALYATGMGKRVIKAKLKRESYTIGESAIEGVLRRRGLWRKRRRKPVKRFREQYVGVCIKYPGQKTSIDIKYTPPIEGKRRYQYTIVDLYTRMTYRAIYDEKTPDNSADFLAHAIKYLPFRIRRVQTDNGLEFTMRMFPHFTSSHPFEEALKYSSIEHAYIPVATPRMNGVVENVHGRDEYDLYSRLKDGCTKRTLEKIVRARNYFWNFERLHSSLGYDTPMERYQAYLKKARRSA
jgi:transposase InsO family protein